jgi:hypothetical protein
LRNGLRITSNTYWPVAANRLVGRLVRRREWPRFWPTYRNSPGWFTGCNGELVTAAKVPYHNASRLLVGPGLRPSLHLQFKEPSMQDVHLESTSNVPWLVLACLVLGSAGCAADSNELDDVSGLQQALACPAPTPTPAALAVPEGNRLAFSFSARGTQNYACKPAADGSFVWTFVEPDAVLYGPGGHVAGHHYAGPTWEANDGSTVAGTRLAGATVDATAIPWLLLQASSHAGSGRMSRVSYVQRLDTVGGLAPTSGCDAEHAAATVDVDYTAKYSFFR